MRGNHVWSCGELVCASLCMEPLLACLIRGLCAVAFLVLLLLCVRCKVTIHLHNTHHYSLAAGLLCVRRL